ncbi:MAG TPA: sigma-54 dependent transcriptional regulator [Gemmatimonadales bacterium]|nr:sigma-54 dependent transcriptional regulator [Gemmatimonadales bacterium]
MTRVLIVDDEPGLRQSLGLLLSGEGYEVTSARTGREGLELALAEPFDLLLCDVRMPELDGIGFLRAYQEKGGTGLVVMMSAYGREDAAIAAMQEGAYDYLPKPFRPDEVILTLKKAEERERLRFDVARLRARLDGVDGGVVPPGGMVAESPALRDVLDIVARVAAHKTTVLITGESGTGKEVVARAIHRASPRAGGPFVGINCAAIPESLLESELFGHVRGAFTGAVADKPGLFEQAERGTILLDEIGEMPAPLQTKLLRVLQEGEIRRVGDQRSRKVDVRVLAATARDLEADAKRGSFREDLLYRLNVVAIHIPPLRQRPEDIPALAHHFARLAAHRLGRRLGLSVAAVEWLKDQSWPGNARELEHTIERAGVLSDHEILEPRDFQPATRGDGAAAASGAARTLRETMDVAERTAIAEALAAAGGNRREAATRLGVSLRTLFYKIARHGLE